MSPARAAVGPLAGEALILPADARFVIGLDVKRFTASPFYEKFAAERGMKPDALAELEEKTGLNPARDIDQIVIAGAGVTAARRAIAVATGRFDLYRLGRAIETDGKAQSSNHEGVTVYTFADDSKQPLAVAFLDESTLVFGPKEQVLAAVSSRTRSEAPLKTNAALMARIEKVRPGSTFWMVGDQSLLASLPTSIPAPGASPDAASTLSLPALTGLTVTGDLDPQVSLSVTGDAKRRGLGQEPGRRGARPGGDGEPAGTAAPGASAAGLRVQRGDGGEPRAGLGARALRADRGAAAEARPRRRRCGRRQAGRHALVGR